MLSFWITVIYALFIEIFGRPTPTPQSSQALFRSSSREPIEPTGNRPHSPIHTLNNDALLNIFYLYRLDVSGEYDEDGYPDLDWGGQRWWYKLAQVCQRWRYLILASPSQLDLHLLCTEGVPITNMLAHSPLLPLTIYYDEGNRKTTEEDEEGILLALRHSGRVHYVSLHLPSPKLRKIITSMDEQFPILECLYIEPWIEDDTRLVLPHSFQAPHLRHLILWHTALPIGSPLLTTTMGFITLALLNIPPSTYFPPSHLLTRLSLIPQLEILGIHFYSPLPNRDVERQLMDVPIMTHIMLPNLRVFSFKGISAYLEGILAQIGAPALNDLEIVLFNQLTFTFPRLLQFMDASETFSSSSVQLTFGNDSAELQASQFREGRRSFRMQVMCRHLDWQVSSAVQILDTLQPVLFVVEELTLSHVEHNRSSEWHNEVDRTQWRRLLRPFGNLKTLRVQDELVGKLAPSLQTDDGEPPLELLPNLKEVECYGGDDARDAFTPFIDERQVAGHPVNLTSDLVFPRVVRSRARNCGERRSERSDRPLYSKLLVLMSIRVIEKIATPIFMAMTYLFISISSLHTARSSFPFYNYSFRDPFPPTFPDDRASHAYILSTLLFV